MEHKSDFSTSLFLFGHVSYYDGNTEIEQFNDKKNIFLNCSFWKSFITKFWQYDDFTFDGAAAVTYVAHAHRFKILFNPCELYKLSYFFFVDDVANDDLWNNIINGNNRSYDSILNRNGWCRSTNQMLLQIQKNKTWDIYSWNLWCTHISLNPHIINVCTCAFVHEMLHVVLNHINRIDDRNHDLWNISTDFAINQTLTFPLQIQRNIISTANKSFIERLYRCLIIYYMSDKNVLKKLKKYSINDKKDVMNIKSIDILNNIILDDNVIKDGFLNKSADFYYTILLETCEFIDVHNVGGYDDHKEWDKINDDDIATQCIDEGKEHEGFKKINKTAASKKEIKSSIKESLERCGINTEDIDTLESAINQIKSLSNNGIGHLIREWFHVPRKNWKQILKKYVTSYSNPQDYDYTMSRESRVISGLFPGKKRDRGLDVIIQTDTSGSICHDDWVDFTNQILEISRSCSVDKVRCIQVHSKISFDGFISLKSIKSMKIVETGGTIMVHGPNKLLSEKNKKLLIIFTDGYIDEFFQKDFPFKIIMFLSRGYENNAKTLEERGFKVICQDSE
jgi:predicted metal-dependent peptidase